MTQPPPRDNARRRTLLGVGSMLLSTATLSGMQVGIRSVPGGMHPYEIAFFRNFFSLLLIMGAQGRGGIGAMKTTKLPLHVLRGVLNVISMLLFFEGVLLAPLSQVAALSFLAPLMASLVAFVVFREGNRALRSATIAAGFVGALIILRPGLEPIGRGQTLVLMNVFAWALALIVIKQLARTDSSVTITIYMSLVMTPLSFVAAVPFWRWPDAEQLLWMALVGALGTVGHLAMAQAFRMADASAVLPLEFFKLIWGSLLGVVLYGERADVWTWVGGSIIFASSIFLTLREARTRVAGGAGAPHQAISPPALRDPTAAEAPDPPRTSP
ncbi:MAG: DMT family transporter [Candidatus Lambdaproteobacteria bacterium]|nr:DMT family transporter [Candidatus Lambdaproteobacteria bacterium]